MSQVSTLSAPEPFAYAERTRREDPLLGRLEATAVDVGVEGSKTR